MESEELGQLNDPLFMTLFYQNKYRTGLKDTIFIKYPSEISLHLLLKICGIQCTYQNNRAGNLGEGNTVDFSKPKLASFWSQATCNVVHVEEKCMRNILIR